MTNLTVQLVLKIEPEVDAKIDQAFIVAKERGSDVITRTDYIRKAISEYCNQELFNYKDVRSPIVNDDLLNKVIWTIFSKLALHKCEETIFRALHLNEFAFGARTKVEEIFSFLADKKCCKFATDHKNNPTISHFNEELLKKIALENFKNYEAMGIFEKQIIKFNTKDWVPVDDFCFEMYTCLGLNAKDALSSCGFIITNTSKCYATDFMKAIFLNSPSEYAYNLWNIPVYKNDEKQQRGSKYITYPDIYLV
jgi:hypothetical protein